MFFIAGISETSIQFLIIFEVMFERCDFEHEKRYTVDYL